MSASAGSLPARLRRYFTEAKKTTKIGGAAVLQELSDLASASISGTTNTQDAVAFALSEIFRLHAEDRDGRLVTGDDTYHLMASGEEHLAEAIKFIENGGSSDDATRIIAALARLTPDRLYGRWPPKIPNGETAT
jgi:hypothetical protein